MTIRALEQSLQAAWHADTAAVYADALTAHGDVRGELIALDLALDLALAAEAAPRSALLARKRALIASWPGTLGDRPWTPHDVVRGLLRDVRAYTPTDLARLEAVAGPYIQQLRMMVDDDGLEPSLARLEGFAGGLPWLRDLTLRRVGTRRIDRAAWHALMAITPHLERLHLLGNGLLDRTIDHPLPATVRSLAIQGLPLHIVAPLPHVEYLDLGVVDVDSLRFAFDDERTAALLARGNFPGLRTLDLARNRRVDELYAWLPRVEAIGQLATLRLPWIAGARIDPVLELLDRHPELRCELVYAPGPLSLHPRLHARHRPWPVAPHPGSVIEIGDGRYGEPLIEHGLVGELETQFDAMRAADRAAWSSLWSILEQPHRELAASTLLAALEAVNDPRADRLAHQLHLAGLPPEANIRITRRQT